MARILLTGGSGFIGTEVAKAALADGHSISNIDIVAPRLACQLPYWTSGDIRDLTSVTRAIEAFRPDILIHLASDTDVQITELEEFSTTIAGTQNVISAVGADPGIKRFVHISTQFVVRPGVTPLSEEHLDPYTIYGEAKATTERMVRSANLRASWLIVRPTIIWGPYHPSFRENIFKHIASGTYLHPKGRRMTMRAFGYVTNAAEQILKLATRGGGNVPDRVFYVGDEVIDYDRWADAFSLGLTGKRARRVPVWLLMLMGKLGDVIKRTGLSAPIDTGRAFRMSTSSAIDLSSILTVAGPPRVSFDSGVKETLEWLACE